MCDCAGHACGALSLISDVVTGSCRCPNISYFEFLAAGDIKRLSVTAPDTTCPNVCNDDGGAKNPRCGTLGVSVQPTVGLSVSAKTHTDFAHRLPDAVNKSGI